VTPTLLLTLACTSPPEVVDSPTDPRPIPDDSQPQDSSPDCTVVTFEGEDWTERFLTGQVVELNEPGTLEFCEGTWFVLLHVTSQVEILGHGADSTVLSGGEQGTVVHVTGEGAHATLRSATLDRGYARGAANEGSGAGIRCDEGASVEVVDAVLSNHDAYDGAGLYARDGCDVVLEDVQFVDNYAEDDGAALRINHGTGSLSQVRFRGNTARDGGAVLLDSSAVTMTGVEFQDNVSRDSQGGAILHYWGTLQVTDARFEGNQANSVGGALALFGDTTLSGVEFLDNSSYEGGGAAHLYPDAGTLTCTDCSFEDNTPSDLGVDGIGTFQGLASFTCDGEGCR
jgi:nitrous oxidase accessory protein NosD